MDTRDGEHPSVPHKLYDLLGPGFKWRVRRCQVCLEHWETVEIDSAKLPKLTNPERRSGINYFAQPRYKCGSCRKELPHMLVWGALAQAEVVGHHKFQCPFCKTMLQAGSRRPPESGKKG